MVIYSEYEFLFLLIIKIYIDHHMDHFESVLTNKNKDMLYLPSITVFLYFYTKKVFRFECMDHTILHDVLTNLAEFLTITMFRIYFPWKLLLIVSDLHSDYFISILNANNK